MIAAIIQARTGSKRLPDKVFKLLCNKPLIWHVTNRLKYSRKIETVILATTLNEKDNALENWASENGIPCFRGSEENVLERYYNAAQYFSVDTIVRITADDPFKDPQVIDKVITLFEEKKLDFAYNNNPPTFPEGLDTEVFSFEALTRAYNSSVDLYEKEHVTQYFYRNPALFSQLCLRNPTDLSYLRWTIDTQKDWDMAEIVYNNLYPSNPKFSMGDILELLKKNPSIAELNSDVKRSAMYIK